MESPRSVPNAQVFVCVNARESADPLQSGCGRAGPLVYAGLKSAVASAGRVADVWVTRTLCLGHCPREGCSVVVYPAGVHRSSVETDDIAQLMDIALRNMNP